MKVICDKEEDFGDYKHRHLRLISTTSNSSNKSEEEEEAALENGHDPDDDDESSVRSVSQFHFVSWPDFGVPRSPDTLLSFLRSVRAARSTSTSPLVVHCSAGIGRTGTFCLMDAFQTLLERQEESVAASAPLVSKIVYYLSKRRLKLE